MPLGRVGFGLESRLGVGLDDFPNFAKYFLYQRSRARVMIGLGLGFGLGFRLGLSNTFGLGLGKNLG